MTKADKIYDIAEKLGYEGDTDGSTVDAINAISDTLGYSGTHQQRISGALSDLNTVVGGGGGGGNLGAGVSISVLKTGAPEHLGFGVGDASMAYLYAQIPVDGAAFIPSGIEYLLVKPHDDTDLYEFSNGNVSATVETNGTQVAFTDFAVIDVTMGSQTTKAVKFTPTAASVGDQVSYTFTISPQSGGGDDVSI